MISSVDRNKHMEQFHFYKNAIFNILLFLIVISCDSRSQKPIFSMKKRHQDHTCQKE